MVPVECTNIVLREVIVIIYMSKDAFVSDLVTVLSFTLLS